MSLRFLCHHRWSSHHPCRLRHCPKWRSSRRRYHHHGHTATTFPSTGEASSVNHAILGCTMGAFTDEEVCRRPTTIFTRPVNVVPLKVWRATVAMWGSATSSQLSHNHCILGREGCCCCPVLVALATGECCDINQRWRVDVLIVVHRGFADPLPCDVV